MTLKDIMTEQADYTSPDATVQEVAQLMQKNDIGFLPVGENDRIIGTITDRDITLNCVAQGKDPSSTTVRDCMREGKLTWCYEDQDLTEAVKRMGQTQVRRLPIMNRDKRFVGVVSIGDIATGSQDSQALKKTLEDVCQPQSRAAAA